MTNTNQQVRYLRNLQITVFAVLMTFIIAGIYGLSQ